MQSEWRERLGRPVNDKLTKGSHQRGERRSGGQQREHRGARFENGGRVFQLQQLV